MDERLISLEKIRGSTLQDEGERKCKSSEEASRKDGESRNFLGNVFRGGMMRERRLVSRAEESGRDKASANEVPR